MSDRLDLRYRTSSENDEDRANAVFSGAVLIYRALPSMHELVDCDRLANTAIGVVNGHVRLGDCIALQAYN